MNKTCIALIIVWARISQLTSNNGQDIIASNDCESWKNEARRTTVHPAVAVCGGGGGGGAHPAGTTAQLKLAQGILSLLSVLGAIINTVHCALKVLMDVCTRSTKANQRSRILTIFNIECRGKKCAAAASTEKIT